MMKNNLGFRRFLRVFAVLLVLCFLPVAAIGDAIVEDVEFTGPR